MYAGIRKCEIPDYVTRNRRLSLPCERGLTVDRSCKNNTTISKLTTSHSRTNQIWVFTALLPKNRLILLGLFNPEHEDNLIFRNVGHYWHNDTGSHNKKNGIVICGSQAIYINEMTSLKKEQEFAFHFVRSFVLSVKGLSLYQRVYTDFIIWNSSCAKRTMRQSLYTEDYGNCGQRKVYFHSSKNPALCCISFYIYRQQAKV